MKNIIIKKENRAYRDYNWLKTFYLFSFWDYIDYENISFWDLRVFNHDIISWNSWFWKHPHDNMEILTIPLSWAISHEDSTWCKWDIKINQIQTMTAWTWIFHSEVNRFSEDVELFQIWFLPNKLWLKPNYETLDYSLKENSLNLLVSWERQEWIWYLNIESKVYIWNYQKDEKFSYEIKEIRGLFVYVFEWSLYLWEEKISSFDQIRFSQKWFYDFHVKEKTKFILIDVSLKN